MIDRPIENAQSNKPSMPRIAVPAKPSGTVAQTGTVSSADEEKPFPINRMCARPCQTVPSLDTGVVSSGSAGLIGIFRPSQWYGLWPIFSPPVYRNHLICVYIRKQ
jgi:hypothetical protein